MSGLFPNALTIAAREYLQRVRSRTFAVVTVVLAVIGLGIALLPIGIRLVAGDSTTSVAVYSTDATLRSSTVAGLTAILETGSGATQWKVSAVDDAAAAAAQVRAGKLDGLLTVSRRSDGELAFSALTAARSSDQRLFAVRQASTQLSIADRLARAGVDPGKTASIFAPTPFEVVPADPNAVNVETVGGPTYVVALVMVILSFMAILTYGQWVASSVAEEKSSRVMELLITAATPRQLLAGKVLGAGAAGLTQYGAVVAATGVGLLLQGTISQRVLGEPGTSLEGVNLWVLAPFGVFFIGGFILYATLYAALGSIAARQEDVQQVTGPMILLGTVGYLATFIGINTPDAAWVQILSLIPFFSPYLLPTRMLLASVAPWEWVVAVALMIVFILGALWVAARIYAAGVLLYGQRASLRAAWRATRVHR
jgi:ABC-2 type transport system permease protein